MTKPVISIIICTYNRASLLKNCLDSLINQNIEKKQYEIIVVNNNSNDNTEEIVKDFLDNYQNIRIVLETNQGLSHSRNRGYREAQAEYVAYMDDDAKASPNWVEIAIQIINKQQPDLFGGPIYPFYLLPKPEWFKDEYEIRVHAAKTGWMESGHISGSNIVFKKSLLAKFGGFNPEFGMKGNSIGFHEETQLINEAYRNKNRVYYSLDLIVNHLVPDIKYSLAYFIYSRYKSGKDYYYLQNSGYNPGNFIDLLDLIDQTMVDLETALNRRDLSLYPFPENYIIERVSQKIFEIGLRVEPLLKRSVKLEDGVINEKTSPEKAFEYFVMTQKKLGLRKFLSYFKELVLMIDFKGILAKLSRKK